MKSALPLTCTCTHLHCRVFCRFAQVSEYAGAGIRHMRMIHIYRRWVHPQQQILSRLRSTRCQRCLGKARQLASSRS